jgi:type I restriction enzyme S subunit
MSSEWRTYRLLEVGRIVTGKTPKSGVPAFDGDDVPFMSPPDFSGNKWITKTVRSISEAGAQSVKGSLIPPRSVLVTCIGSDMGKAAIAASRCVTNQQINAILVEESRFCPEFVYYNLSLRKDEIRSLAGGSAQPILNKSAFGQIFLEAPSLEVQRKVSAALRPLDDRITLLRETNATLEAIAQTLFKSWFVDFDPVRAKMAGRTPEGMDEAMAALFPDSLDLAAAEPIPSGWMRSFFGDICSVTIGGLWGNDDQEESELIPAISLRGVDLEHLRSNGYAPDAPIRWVKASAMEKRRLSASQVLIASSGAGPCGRPLWAGGPFETMYGLPVIFSNFVKRLECGSEIRALYVDRLLAEMRESKEIWNFINGTSIPNLDDKLLLASKQVVMPPDLILEAFADVLRSIYCKLYSGQAQTLATLRDTLLPRLISGQLRLPEAQAQLEDALA